MSTLTPNFALVKAAVTEQYDVAIVNANLDKIDLALEANEVATQANEDAIADYAKSSNGFNSYAFTAGLSVVIPHGLGRIPKAVLISQWAGSSWNGVFLSVSQTAGHLDATNFRIRAKDAANADLTGNVGVIWVAF